MCLYPQLVTNPKYKATKKNEGNIPYMEDKRVAYVPIGCGNCIECAKLRAREWQVRLLEEVRTNSHGKFITLTFSDESIAKLNETETIWKINKLSDEKKREQFPIKSLSGYDKDNAIAARAVRLFLERWRKEFGKSIKHWLITELGHQGTENIHIHGIIWTNYIDKIEEHWQYGHVWKGKKVHHSNNQYSYINYVNERTVNYITKYITKKDEQHRYYKPIILTSPGIGSNYTNRTDARSNVYNGKQTNECYRNRQGYKLALPIYYRNKIYSERERELLWLQKLDTQTRYVCGNKINIQTDETEYQNALKYYRKINAELGYKDNTTIKEKQKYENDRRNLLNMTRIRNANNNNKK